MSDTKFEIFKSLSRFTVYLTMALALFFAAAFMVFVLRGQNVTTNTMPDLVNRYYVDVHNDLQRLQLRVSIEKKHFPDQGIGRILYQDVPAGRQVQPQDKLYLVVNQPEPVLTMPEFKRGSLAAAKAGIQKIPYEDRVYNLEIGAVTELETDSFPDQTVIDQYPEPGVDIAPGSKVWFLVARKPQANAPAKEIKLDELIGQNAGIAMQYLARSGLDYRIATVKPAEHADQNGTLFQVKPGRTVQLGVYYTPAAVRFRDGLELVDVELDGSGRCVAQTIPMVDGSAVSQDDERRRQVFVTQNHGPDENVKMLFFRSGSRRLEVKCGDDVIFDREYAPDDLS
ncbi:MAG: PASTA domain-containing protein [Leptospiraceae bacterium]|nr:PASTA domain-containing protein [Leptospiraceae bacterium]